VGETVDFFKCIAVQTKIHHLFCGLVNRLNLLDDGAPLFVITTAVQAVRRSAAADGPNHWTDVDPTLSAMPEF